MKMAATRYFSSLLLVWALVSLSSQTVWAENSCDARTTQEADVVFVDNFPWLVKLYTVAALWCSGVLIAPNWVLTSASCFDMDPHANHYHVQFWNKAGGSGNGSSEGAEKWPRPAEPWEQIPQIVSSVVPNPTLSSSSSLSVWYADAYFLHGRYQLANTSCHNLALLRLLKNVTAPFSPAQLSQEAKLDVCYSVGWGPESGNDMFPMTPTVRKWNLTRTTNCSCLSGDQAENDRLLAEPLCPRTGPCKGDVGSPLMCRDPTDGNQWKVAGLVSQLWRCPGLRETWTELEPQQATFLDISYYIPFIEKLQRHNPQTPNNR